MSFSRVEGGRDRRVGGQVHVGHWRDCSRQRNDSEAEKGKGRRDWVVVEVVVIPSAKESSQAPSAVCVRVYKHHAGVAMSCTKS